MKNLFTQRNLIIVLAAILGFFGFLVALDYGLKAYNNWKFNQELTKLEEEMNKPYLEDIYGGKTPKETLELFIAAVEKEDFDLASKYFVLSKQEEWKKKLKNGKENDSLKNLFKLIDDEMEILNKAEPLWIFDDKYISPNKVLFEYIKYPQGIWKISEI